MLACRVYQEHAAVRAQYPGAEGMLSFALVDLKENTDLETKMNLWLEQKVLLLSMQSKLQSPGGGRSRRWSRRCQRRRSRRCRRRRIKAPLCQLSL